MDEWGEWRVNDIVDGHLSGITLFWVHTRLSRMKREVLRPQIILWNQQLYPVRILRNAESSDTKCGGKSRRSIPKLSFLAIC